MSLSLSTVQTSLESLSVNSKKDRLVNVVKTIGLRFKDQTDKKKRLSQAKVRRRALSSKKEVPISEWEINPTNRDLHAIDNSVLATWCNAMHKLLTAYRQAVQVAETRSAHMEAWEAAFLCLHEREVDSALNDPCTAPREPMAHAMHVAKIKIGQPHPLADWRFLVKAIWLTLHIHLILTDMTATWIDMIHQHTKDNTTQQFAWVTYIGFLFQSCLQDADIAFAVTKDSKSHRQISKTALYQMQIPLEEFQFDMMMCKLTGSFQEKDHRNTLAERALGLCEQADALMETTIQEHQMKKPGAKEMEWLEMNFSSIAQDIVDEWGKIVCSICLDMFYQPISLQERINIIKAFQLEFCEY